MTKYRKMLSDWQAPYLQALIAQIETQSKQTLIKWAVDYASEQIMPVWSRYFPQDERPQLALKAARDWSAGAIKLPSAKKVILECHAAARDAEGEPAAQAAARAIGQCASSIHSARHCIGLPLYGALALAYDKLGSKAGWTELEARAAQECAGMLSALREVSVPDETNPAGITWVC